MFCSTYPKASTGTQTIAEAMAATSRAAQSLPVPTPTPLSSPPSISIAAISAWRPGQSINYHI